MEKTLAVWIKDWHEQDDTIGYHKLAVLLTLSSTVSPEALSAAFLIGAIIPAWGNRCVEHTALSLDLDSAFYSCY